MRILLTILVVAFIAVSASAQVVESGNSCFSIGMSFNEDSMGMAMGYYNTGISDGFGFYSNVAIDFTAPIDNIETQQGRWFSWHYATDHKYQNYIGNVGVALKPAETLILYAGGGIAIQDSLTHWRSDAMTSLHYWAYDGEYEYSGNFNAGLIFKPTKNMGVDVGFNSASSGGYVSLAVGF